MERTSLNGRWAYGQPHQPFVTPRKRRWSGIAAITAIFMAFAGVALADNTVPDGDGVTPVTANALDLGTVCVNGSKTDDALIGITRNGNYTNANVFKKGTTATVSVLSATAGLSSTVGSPNTIAIPSDWDTAQNNTVAGSVTASVTLTAGGTAGPYSGTVTFRSSGTESDDTSLTRDGTLSVTATISDTGACAPPPADSTPPVITPNISGTLGNNGWYTSDVTVTFSVVDGESTVTSKSAACDATNTVTADTNATGVTFTCTATSAGGTASESVTIKRDATAPTVSLVGGPAHGASYYFGSVPAAPTCSASDPTPGSGLAGTCVVSGYSAAVGTHTVTGSASDNAGNSSSASATYTVLAWTVQGFYAPVDRPDTFNITKNGSTVPLKFEVFAGPTELTDVSVVDTFVQKTNCSGAGDTDAIEEYATGSTSLRYDTTGGQFIFNWKTPKTAGVCYKVTMTTDDGSSIYANFNLK